jgi:hypothetical protein
MAKEFYKVTYSTYANERIKPVLFQGRSTYPLYVQVTYDRKNQIFKSYYFDLYVQPKYDYLRTTIDQIDELESRAISFVTARFSDKFDLIRFPSWYKMFNKDVLDALDTPFKEWLITYFQKEKVNSYVTLLRQGIGEVCALELLDEYKMALAPDLYERLITTAIKEAPPYIPLATYIRHQLPKGPFCLPLHEWIQEDKQDEIDDFMQDRDDCWGYDLLKMIRTIKQLVYPQGLQ